MTKANGNESIECMYYITGRTGMHTSRSIDVHFPSYNKIHDSNILGNDFS